MNINNQNRPIVIKDIVICVYEYIYLYKCVRLKVYAILYLFIRTEGETVWSVIQFNTKAFSVNEPSFDYILTMFL